MKWKRIWKWTEIPVLFILGWNIRHVVLLWNFDLALALIVILAYLSGRLDEKAETNEENDK